VTPAGGNTPGGGGGGKKSALSIKSIGPSGIKSNAKRTITNNEQRPLGKINTPAVTPAGGNTPGGGGGGNTPEKKEVKIMTQAEANKWKKEHGGEWFKIVKEFEEYKKEKGLPTSTTFLPSYSPEMISRYLAKQQKGGGAKRRTRKRKSGRRTRKNRRTK
jgi:hypothetical protein